ncbi:TPA: hypothetical protein PTV74_003151 [Clostridium botulinum]|nr:hypothetical protein [Clostridium botulinum]HDK7206306.1 hypothetical protein [Clostridium botulinum]HDK7210042.1 hypothetical protein [Clostridium botulinum]HDK7265491.1 hypothetical protein [Clostridium botulinum]HDK7269339.1 hypothetical protein [Clostridium botulinum]
MEGYLPTGLDKKDLKIETYKPDNVKEDTMEHQSYGVKIIFIPEDIVVKSEKYKTQRKNYRNCINQIYSKLPNIKQNCFNCKFYDEFCCMYKCALMAILDEEDEAMHCKNYIQGIYDAEELEESDYR